MNTAAHDLQRHQNFLNTTMKHLHYFDLYAFLSFSNSSKLVRISQTFSIVDNNFLYTLMGITNRLLRECLSVFINFITWNYEMVRISYWFCEMTKHSSVYWICRTTQKKASFHTNKITVRKI